MRDTSDGYVLIETLIASAITIVLAAGVGSVATMTGRTVRASADQSTAVFLAVQKLEQLRALTYTYDADHQPVTDARSNLAVDPTTDGGAGLGVTAPIATGVTGGAIDYLDRDGRWIGTGPQPPPGTAFARRWSVSRARPSEAAADVLAFQVAVVSMRGREAIVWGDIGPSQPQVVWLATARARW